MFRRIIVAYGEGIARTFFPYLYLEEVRYSAWLYEHRPESGPEDGSQC